MGLLDNSYYIGPNKIDYEADTYDVSSWEDKIISTYSFPTYYINGVMLPKGFVISMKLAAKDPVKYDVWVLDKQKREVWRADYHKLVPFIPHKLDLSVQQYAYELHMQKYNSNDYISNY